ncbi:MAG: oligoendopeptidase F [Clostridia bacterium]|nr:oligoendopeptidase F [Clostridia bacterium]
MDIKYTWQIEDIYKNEKEWEKDFEKVKSMLDFSAFAGTLGEKQGFLACMKKSEEVSRILEKLSVYAMMLHDSDTRNSAYDSLYSRVSSLGASLGANTAFITPELTALDNSVLEGYIADPDFSAYDYSLKCLLKKKAHVLSKEEEKLLALSSEALGSFRDIFTKIDNADLPLGTITHKGEKIELTHGTYGFYMQHPDRALRKKVFKKYYSAYKDLLNTISATYYGSVKKDVFYAKACKYDSALDKALSLEDVDKKVYANLIKTANDALPLLHDYIAQKKKALKLKQMHMYDMYVPTVEGADLKLDYEKAYDLVIQGLKPLGEEYKNLLITARDNRWIDVFESKGKRSGAYSVCVYDTHPYVLLNYTKTTHDVFTIAHEMGHSIHSYYSNKNQPYDKADYKIFVAEVASTVNEVLLIKHLLANATDNKLKKYLLSYLLEMIRTTLFRQTQFAEFEEFSHSSVEQDKPLTKDSACAKYLSLNQKYYGKAIVHDEEIATEWARIPHFYRAFYVYKYATGIISALAIADRILTEGEVAVKDYFNFLSSGNSDSPVELLKIAGVDLTEEKPFISAFKVFGDALEQFKQL